MRVKSNLLTCASQAEHNLEVRVLGSCTRPYNVKNSVVREGSTSSELTCEGKCWVPETYNGVLHGN